jgi:hypothetical protein
MIARYESQSADEDGRNACIIVSAVNMLGSVSYLTRFLTNVVDSRENERFTAV